MKDFRIGDLGGPNNINGITKKGKTEQKNTVAVGQNFMVAGLKRFNKVSPANVNTNTNITDLNLPDHMKEALAHVAKNQADISDTKPLIPDGRNIDPESIDVTSQTYINDIKGLEQEENRELVPSFSEE